VRTRTHTYLNDVTHVFIVTLKTIAWKKRNRGLTSPARHSERDSEKYVRFQQRHPCKTYLGMGLQERLVWAGAAKAILSP